MEEHEANKIIRNVHVAIAHLDRIDEPTQQHKHLLLKCIGDLVVVRDRWHNYTPRPTVNHNVTGRMGWIEEN